MFRIERQIGVGASIQRSISGVSNRVVSYSLDPRACKRELEVMSAEVEPIEGGHHTGTGDWWEDFAQGRGQSCGVEEGG